MRISLFDTSKKLQVIVKRVGVEDAQRFGSVSFHLKKLASGVGNTYMQWVTLFDDMHDDMYDGQLGEDDWELPRILIEYSVVGGAYTSTMNWMDQLKHKITANQSSAQAAVSHLDS